MDSPPYFVDYNTSFFQFNFSSYITPSWVAYSNQCTSLKICINDIDFLFISLRDADSRKSAVYLFCVPIH